MVALTDEPDAMKPRNQETMPASFRTVLPTVQTNLDISHASQVICFGSCFAEHMGRRLKQLKFRVLTNPSGIVYNPVSVADSLEMLLADRQYTAADLFENAGLWHSFDHHGSFSHPDKQVVLENIHRSLSAARHFLEQTDRLLVTLGTANVAVLNETGKVVANCHKMPGKAFERKRLSVGEIAGILAGIFEKLKTRLPALEVVVTVSPVRHLRDGLVENQRSKATLLLALEAVSLRCPFVHYFPAYELVLDDLRDYRFYEPDMAHPNQQAVEYIWQYFGEAYFNEKTKALCQRLADVSAALAHRPFHPESAEHQFFLKKQQEKIAQLAQEYPLLDFSREMALLAGQVL